jgi:ADP-heptose:LPS heptosyltransferase
MVEKPINKQHRGSTGPRRMILHQGAAPGDNVVLTRAVGDLKRSYPQFEIDVDTPYPEVWENNPHLTPGLRRQDPEVEVHDCHYGHFVEKTWHSRHFADAFREDLEERLGVPIAATGYRPELYLSEKEQAASRQIDDLWDGPFWLLNAGWKTDFPLKHYHRWPEVVEEFNARFWGKVALVQVGQRHPRHQHIPLNGVFDLLGKTTLRQLIVLCAQAEGTIGPVSCHLHIAAAFDKPCVVVAGGRENVRWEGYDGQRWLGTNGAIAGCPVGGCWKTKPEACVDRLDGVPLCMAMTSPEAVCAAIFSYYDGGRLALPVEEAVA